jgi:hypothetical protein
LHHRVALGYAIAAGEDFKSLIFLPIDTRRGAGTPLALLL